MDLPLRSSIGDRIGRLRQQLPDSVRLIAVSKQVSVELMRQAYGAGIRDFGENRVQEAIAKQAQLQDLPDIQWHFIGHLQTNKARLALQTFDWIHSVDSLSLALRLERLASETPATPKLLLQVKLLPDPNKFGWSVAELQQDLAQLATCQHLDIQGLMTILPLGLTPEEQLAAFVQLKNLATQWQSQHHLFWPELSMGMSDDFALAVQAGATMVRLGRIVFGERLPKI